MTSGTPDLRFDRDSACAIVITYDPDGGFATRLNRFTSQVASTVIVDNGSSAGALSMLHAAASLPGVTLLANRANLGIATALNQGVAHALARGYAWAVLFDQDTLADADLVQTLLIAVASVADAARVAAAGSSFRDSEDRPAESRYLGAEGELWREVESIITSGTLLSLPIFKAIGPFRDEFFIDYVDIEYCLRARARGYRIIETRKRIMSHTVGAPTRHRQLGQKKWTTNHPPDRRYYIARNNTVLLREYGVPNGGSWRLKSIVRSMRLCKRIAFFETDKIAKITAVAAGWWDGMRGTLGPRNKD